jgi:hypothetical protein
VPSLLVVQQYWVPDEQAFPCSVSGGVEGQSLPLPFAALLFAARRRAGSLGQGMSPRPGALGSMSRVSTSAESLIGDATAPCSKTKPERIVAKRMI